MAEDRHKDKCKYDGNYPASMCPCDCVESPTSECATCSFTRETGKDGSHTGSQHMWRQHQNVTEDVVKKPKHYQVIEGVEAIELIARALTVAEFKGYCLGNIMKYRLRAGGKDDLVQEIAKAKFYVDLFELHKSQCRAS